RRVDREDPSVASLEGLLVWVAGRGVALAAGAPDEDGGPGAGVRVSGIAAPAVAGGASEVGSRAAAHFEATRGRAIRASPLADDRGTLGAIGFEAGGVRAVTEASQEAALVVAQQATVALRNARLYRELPLLSLLEPVRRGRRRLREIPGRRLALALGATGV